MGYSDYYKGYARNKITCRSFLDASRLFTPTVGQKHALGRILEIDDGTGRAWRYSKNGAVNLTRAFMNASEAPSANGLEIAQTGYTHSVGDKKFNILLTTVHNYSDHELIDGYLYFNKSPGAGSTVGDCYLIKDNKIITDDTVMQIEIADEDGLRTALIATDELSIVKNPFRDVVVNPTSQAAMVVGVNNVDVTASYYFWAQFRGPCACIGEDTVVIGEPVGKPATHNTAGTVGPLGADTDQIYGVAMTAGADDEPSLINLMLP